MAQRAAERVPGTEPVQHLDRERRGFRPAGRGHGQHPAGSLLNHGQVGTPVQQGLPGPLRVLFGHRHVALVEVADRDRDVAESRADRLAGRLPRWPEHGPVVQVQHGEGGPAARLQRGQRG
jgi:hypothetical protein